MTSYAPDELPSPDSKEWSPHGIDPGESSILTDRWRMDGFI